MHHSVLIAQAFAILPNAAAPHAKIHGFADLIP